MSTSALGTDFYCADDIDAEWSVETDPRAMLLQACYRRLSVKLFYDADYGTPLFDELLDISDAADLQRRILRELLKDERVRDVRLTVADAAITVQIAPHGDDSYPLTLTIERVSGALLGSSTGA
jgi:hypothetical protein